MALNVREALKRPAKASKPSKQLRPQVVAAQKRGLQVLLAQTATTKSVSTMSTTPVRSAFITSLRVKPRLTVK